MPGYLGVSIIHQTANVNKKTSNIISAYLRLSWNCPWKQERNHSMLPGQTCTWCCHGNKKPHFVTSINLYCAHRNKKETPTLPQQTCAWSCPWQQDPDSPPPPTHTHTLVPQQTCAVPTETTNKPSYITSANLRLKLPMATWAEMESEVRDLWVLELSSEATGISSRLLYISKYFFFRRAGACPAWSIFFTSIAQS